MSSCNGDYTDWAAPQSNPQEEAITLPGLKATAVAAQDLAATGDSVATFTLSAATLPEGYSLKDARIELMPKEMDGATVTTVNTDLTGKALTADMQSLIETVYGKRPQARTFDAQVYLNAVKNGQAVLIDAGKIAVVETPKAPKISANYYVIGGAQDWQASATAKTQKFNHSDADVYDDPVFVTTISASFNDAGERTDTWFAFGDDEACESIGKGDWSKVIGTANGNGSQELTGTLNTRSELGNDGSICMPATDNAKFYRITLNMMDYKYTIEPLNFGEYFYLVGGNTGWGNGNWAMVSPNGDGKYMTFCFLDQEFKFKPNAGDWTDDLEYLGEGKLGQGEKNIPAPAAGFYKVELDFGSLTYQLTPFTEMRLVGGAAPGGWDAGNAMTYDKDTHTWTLKGITLTDGDIKFRSDNDWNNIDLGGSLDKLTFKGGNISVKAGTYDITLKLENGTGYPHAELTPVN